jgi:hypothetical protein
MRTKSERGKSSLPEIEAILLDLDNIFLSNPDPELTLRQIKMLFPESLKVFAYGSKKTLEKAKKIFPNLVAFVDKDESAIIENILAHSKSVLVVSNDSHFLGLSRTKSESMIRDLDYYVLITNLKRTKKWLFDYWRRKGRAFYLRECTRKVSVKNARVCSL